MNRNLFVRTLLAVAAGLATIGGAQAQAVKLTLGHGAAVGNPRHEASVKFAEVVKAKSGGRIEVTSELGTGTSFLIILPERLEPTGRDAPTSAPDGETRTRAG